MKTPLVLFQKRQEFFADLRGCGTGPVTGPASRPDTFAGPEAGFTIFLKSNEEFFSRAHSAPSLEPVPSWE